MMGFITKFASVVIAGCFAGIPSAQPAFADSLITGTNVVNISVFPAKRQILVSELAQSGVQIVRMGIDDLTGADADKRFGFIALLYASGIKVDLIIKPQFPTNAPLREKAAGPGKLFSGPGLSSADPQLSLMYFQALLQKLESQNIVLAGLELGNELNGPSFNPDFPINGEGRVFGLADLQGNDPQARIIAGGFRQYIKILDVLKQARDGSRLNQATPIISFGLASSPPVGPVGPESSFAHLDIVDPDAAVQYLRENGMDRYVDAYGVHWYGAPHGQTAAQNLAELLSVCGVDGSKPCFITEWGGENKNISCPVDDGKRAISFRRDMDIFRGYASQGRLLGALEFDWDAGVGSNAYDNSAIFRCGALTDAGRAALGQ